MEDLKVLFSFCFDLLKKPFTIYGFTFSFWSIIVWSILGAVAFSILKDIFSHGGDD